MTPVTGWIMPSDKFFHLLKKNPKLKFQFGIFLWPEFISAIVSAFIFKEKIPYLKIAIYSHKINLQIL